MGCEPGGGRGRRGRCSMDASGVRSAGDIQRRDPGYGIDGDARRADLCARARVALCAGARRPAGRSASGSPSTPRRRRTARSRRRRCLRISDGRTCARCRAMQPTRCASTRLKQMIDGRCRRRDACRARSSRRRARRRPPRSIRSRGCADIARAARDVAARRWGDGGKLR